MIGKGHIRVAFEAAMANENFNKALDRISNKSSEVEAMTEPQKKTIIDKVEDTADYIDKFGPISTIKSYFVETKGFSEGDFSKIENLLKKESDDSLTALLSYIKSPMSIGDFTSITKPVNIAKQISAKTGIGYSILSELFKMDGETKAGKGVGKGEVFLGFMIDGAVNATKGVSGDVIVNGEAYEVKARQARLNAQNGFQLGSTALNSLFLELNKLFKDSDVNENFEEMFTATEKSNHQSYNLGSKKESKFFELYRSMIEFKIIDGAELSDLIASTMFVGSSGIWPNASAKIKKLVSDAFNDNIGSGKFNKSSNTVLNYTLMYANILYYAELEKFKGIFMINPNNGNFAYFDQNKAGVKWLISNTKYQQPNWQDNPTSSMWKIELK